MGNGSRTAKSSGINSSSTDLRTSASCRVLVALQIEDLLGMVDPVNVPGTDREYPNWQRKLSTDIEDMVGRTDFDETFSAVGHARG